MSNGHAFALIVGVGEYRAFDPSGGADLAGPTNDVLAWYSLARDTGVPPENIRICVSPALPHDALGFDGDKVTVTGATKAEVKQGLNWLAAQLESSEDKALLTWSGHGTRNDDGEVLCPSDISAKGDTLQKALPLSKAQSILAERAPGSRITTFIDACHDDTGFNYGGRARALPWTPAASDPKGTAAGLGDLVISSSEKGKPSHELPTSNGVTGAFSWAAVELLRRWGRADGTSGLTATELTARTGQMMASMAIEQTPVYLGPPELADARIFSAEGDPAGSAEPKALGGIEIWPETDGKVLEIKLEAPTGEHLGTAYVTGSFSGGQNGWDKHRRYWHWNTNSSTNGGIFFDNMWPKSDFTSKKPVQHNPSSINPPTNHFREYSESSSYQSNGTHTLSHLYYQIDKTTGGSNSLAGYFEIDKNSSGHFEDDHVHVLTPSGATVGDTVLGGSDTATFIYKPGSPTSVSYATRFKDHLKTEKT